MFLPAPGLPEASAVAISAAIFLGPGLVNVQSPAVELVAVESGDSLSALAVISHFHESKAFGASGIAIGYDVHTDHRSIRLEERSNRLFGCPEAEISYKYVFHLMFFLKFAEQQIEDT